MSAIEVLNLKKRFGKKYAINDLSFTVNEGEVFGFLGPNGAGKTTTIRCLLGFLKPNSGQIKILQKDNKVYGTQIRKDIGYLSGDVRFYDNWTGKDHILFFEKLRKQRSIARDLVIKLNLDPHICFKALSSGNKQKLGLILALMFEPKILIMDEPTVGLDPLLQNTIYLMLDELKKRGTTIFISSHNLPEVDRICDRVGIIKDGKIIAVESIQSLKDKRMHVVKVIFNGPFDMNDFRTDGLEIDQQLPNGLMVGTHGSINTLVQKLAKYDIRELEITHASLEEIFLEYYGGTGTSVQKPSEVKMDTLITPSDIKDIPELKE